MQLDALPIEPTVMCFSFSFSTVFVDSLNAYSNFLFNGLPHVYRLDYLNGNEYRIKL